MFFMDRPVGIEDIEEVEKVYTKLRKEVLTAKGELGEQVLNVAETLTPREAYILGYIMTTITSRAEEVLVEMMEIVGDAK